MMSMGEFGGNPLRAFCVKFIYTQKKIEQNGKKQHKKKREKKRQLPQLTWIEKRISALLVALVGWRKKKMEQNGKKQHKKMRKKRQLPHLALDLGRKTEIYPECHS